MMFQLITFSGSKVEKVGRASGPSVIGTAEGDNARDYDSEIFQSHGIVSRPSKKTRGVRIRIGPIAIVIAAYTYGIDPPSNPGACKVYSTNADGVEQGTHLIDSDGVHTFNGGNDFAARFSVLQTAFNSLQATVDNHVHPDPVSGFTGALTVPSTADISGAKVSEVKLP